MKTLQSLIPSLRSASSILARRSLLLLTAGLMLVQPCPGQGGTWTATGSLITGRDELTATLLPNGKVLVAGGINGSIGYLASAELYDPASATWTAAGSLANGRAFHTATLLPDGKVLVAGGENPRPLASARLYDPATGTWTATGSLDTARWAHTATLLLDGKVLAAGGSGRGGTVVLARAELYVSDGVADSR